MNNDTLSKSQDEAELADLMRRSQAGDAGSYRLLLARLKKMTSQFVDNSFARLGIERAGAATDDVVQEVLLGLHLKRNTYDPTQYFLPWFYAIARYKIIDHFRRHRIARQRQVSIDDELETLEASLYAPTVDLTAGQDVEKLMGHLSPKQREILKLVKVDGLSVAEVAARTGYSASDIKVNVHRAIKALRLAIEDGLMANKTPRTSDQLIDQLSMDLQPVRPLSTPARWTFSAAIVGIAIAAISVLTVAPRADLIAKLSDGDFWFDVVTPLLLLLSTLFLCSVLARPGRKANSGLFLSTALASALVVFNVVEIFYQPVAAPTGFPADLACGLFVIVVASVFAAFLLWRSRAGAPQRPWALGASVGVAAFAAGCLAISLHCGSDNATHITLWHILIPSLILTGIASVAGERILRW